ncbi:MAG TPA: sigma-70 family RNA polymerase sigma factor [Phycisphaerales bacterium]|nr:sigma-70 family RNA polymerase sigma factor [Phycisphaerales bacterium]HMP37245.1 sigma-70 family RNA polymerase sigma factor [Phycisphaerales bacterium]
MPERSVSGSSSLTDHAVLARAAAGDAAAIGALAAQIGPTLRAALAGAIPQRWQALVSIDDVIQQAWADAVIALGSFEPRGPGTFEGWMITIARNNLRNTLRMLEADKRGGSRVRVTALDRDSSYMDLLDAIAGDGSTPSRHVALVEARRALDEAIGKLPETYRMVVRSYDLDGRSADEIAGELGRSPGAIYMLRARALRSLAELLGSPSGLLSRR